MSRLVPAIVALALIGCGTPQDANGDGIADGIRTPDSVSQVAASKAVGSISGTVTNIQLAGLDGVQVSLVLGDGSGAGASYKANTNAEGGFLFENVPAGSSGQLFISKGGYSTARVTVSVPSSAGNFPLNDGNGNAGVIALSQLTSTVKVSVYTATGKPARGARALLEVNPTAFSVNSGSFGGNLGNVSFEATVDENGMLTFSNVPDIAEMARMRAWVTVNYQLTVGAIDEDDDGRVEFLGTATTYTAQDLFTNPTRSLTLGDARTTSSLSISNTNLASFSSSNSAPYRNALKANDPITIVFNQPITSAGTTRLVKVVGEDCQTDVPVTVTQRAPNVLSIAPQSSWTLGDRYNVIVRATGLDSGSTNEFIGYFFAMDASAPRPLSSTATFRLKKATGNMTANTYEAGDTVYVEFDAPIIAQSGALSARVHVNIDHNGDMQIGGTAATVEFGADPDEGFSLSNAEQLTATDPVDGTFTCKSSGYSSRWEVNYYNGANPLVLSTQMRVNFQKDNSSADTYQTIWGAPVPDTVNGTLQ